MSSVIRQIGQRSDEWHEDHREAELTEYLVGVGGMDVGIGFCVRLYARDPDDAIVQFKQYFGQGVRGGIEIGDVDDEDVTYAQLYLYDSAITVRNITEAGDQGFDAEQHLSGTRTAGVLKCPKCGEGRRLSFVERVLGNCGLRSEEICPEDGAEDAEPVVAVRISADGTVAYDNEGTVANWDTGEPVRDARGDPQVECGDCGHTWFEPRVTGGA